MATSIKLSELQSLANLTLSDLLLITDAETSTSRKITFQNLRDSLSLADIPGYDTFDTTIDTRVATETTNREAAVAALQALIDALQTEADARNTRITTLETTVDDLDIDLSPETLNSLNELAAAIGDDPAFITTVNDSIAAVQADVNQNEADADAADAALSARLDVLEVDPTTQADVNAVNQSLTISIGQLSDKFDALDVDIAPETLDSINELAAAMGDDPTFLTTLQARVTTIENDNATQTELDAYKAEIEDRNLQLALAYDTPLYVDTLFGG